MAFLIFAIVFGAVYLTLDAIVPALRVNRVGGLLHWRAGRLGGSFYIAKRAR